LKHHSIAGWVAPIVLLWALPVSTTFAQDQTSDQNEASLQEIVVTGSRIARPELQSTTPIQIIDAGDIAASGHINTGDVLRDLPAVGVSGFSSANSNFLTSGSGVNTVNLRNLGDSRTLVLINGRRMVPGIAGTTAADLNMVPTDFIDRIDVITGGASAVYGSDAIAGVVNIVYKQHFNGVTIRGQGGGATQGGENTRLGSLTFGGDFADNRGNAIFNVSYDKDSGLMSRQRSISKVDTSVSFPGIFGAYSSFIPAGNMILADSAGNPIDGLYTFNSSGATVPYDTAQFGFNRDAYRRITVPLDRTLVSGVMGYQIADNHQLYSEFTYGITRSRSALEPFPLGIGPQLATDNVYGGSGVGIPLTNVFIPADLRAIIAADNADPNATGGCSTGVTADCITYIGMRRRLTDLAIRSSDARRQTTRVVGGIRGDIFQTPWQYDVYYQFGRTTDNQVSTGQLNVANLRFALDSVIDPATGQPACRDPVAVSFGCVPINVFGANTITPAAAAYINALQTRDVVIQQNVVSAVAQGPAFKMPAGDVRVVVGAERRVEQSGETWDALTNAGLNGGNALPNTYGAYSVKEVFGEFSMPLLADKPAAKELTLEGALRSSDYSTVGRVTTWNVRLNWAPIEDLRFRGAYSKAVRAPNIGELFTGPSQNFPTGIADPCDGVTAAQTDAVATACKKIPAIAAAIAAGGFNYSFLDYQTITGFDSGNPALNAEKAKTYTLGMVITPTAWKNFSASVDYFNIKIDDAISSVDYPTLMSDCLLTGSAQSCRAVFRNPNTGKIFRLDQLSINVATEETAGIDFAVRYRTDLPGAAGNLSLALSWTYLQRLDQIPQPGSAVVHYKGQIGTSTNNAGPGNRGTLQIGWNGYGFDARWTARYISAMKDQVDPENVSPNQLPFNSVPSYTYHDLDLRYTFDQKVKTALFAGLRNVFDKKPPFLPGGMASSATGVETNPDYYDAIGRQWFAGAEVSF